MKMKDGFWLKGSMPIFVKKYPDTGATVSGLISYGYIGRPKRGRGQFPLASLIIRLIRVTVSRVLFIEGKDNVLLHII